MGPATLHEFFERAARCWPDHIAVDVPPGEARAARSLTTYAALEADANTLALHLRAFVRGECVVAILLPRTTAHLYLAQLAVLKAGAAYTCLDCSFPDERLREILEDSRAAVVLTDQAGAERIRRCALASLSVIEIARAVAPASETARVAITTDDDAIARIDPGRLAYLIYTSGTTGRPKGVMIEHRSIANLVASDVETFRLSPADRVAQNSSAAYDSSIEETWLAFAAGATLVVMDDATVRLGPDLVAWLRRERITVFCPPPTLLRATGCSDPAAALPDLKLLYVGGEALPRDIADRWSAGRTLVNGYGPTECTVTCLREKISAGEPITIGRPVPGATAWVLDEANEETAPEKRGELCIGGIGLARGYWQRPDLTAEKFITHPRFGRLYRTGDLVHRDLKGLFFYHGRIDSQVKLRGYRIELGEIESRLIASPGVRAAACYVHDEEGYATLGAVVVPADSGSPPSSEALQSALRKVLPDYMVPARIGFADELPTTVGGKLNRGALPGLNGFVPRKVIRVAPPRTPLEEKIRAAFAAALLITRTISIDEDFFNALGGDSLSAAQLVTILRDDPLTAWATVRDIYETRTVAALAARAPHVNGNSSGAARTPAGATSGPPRRRRWRTGALQAGWLATNFALGSLLTYFAIFQLLPRALEAIDAVVLVLLAPPAMLVGVALYAVVAVLYAAAVKRFLIGRYVPLRAPVWSDFYLRNWIVQKTVRLIPWWLLESTEFQNAALRALGARIGRRVHLHRGVDLLRGGWDLLEIGDDVTLAQDVTLELVRYESGEIVFAPVSLGNGCTVETHAHVGAGARMTANAFLSARSSLARDATIPAGERWDGIPARGAGNAPPAPALPARPGASSPRWLAARFVLARLILASVLLLPVELLALSVARFSGLDAHTALSWIAHPAIDGKLLAGCVAVAVLQIPFLLLTEALACRALGRVSPGIINRWSPGYIPVSLKAGLVESGSRWLYGTLFWPSWLRLAGMQVGARCEISSVLDAIPELVEIGDQSFCADGIYIVTAQIHRGTVTLARVRLGRNNFVGNGAIIPGGTQVPDDILLGVCTVADASFLRPGTSWFGHPPFEMPRRGTTEFDRSLTHTPTAWRYGVRVFWELLRFSLPATAALIVPIWYALVARAAASLPLAALVLVAIPLLNLAALSTTTVMMIAIKWALLGRVRPGVHPLWSAWASRWDFVCLAWNIYAADTVTLLDGTPWLVGLLRVMGVRVGKDVVFGNGFAEDLPDPDMLSFEDGATVDCLFQAHTFEDRVLKMDYVTVRRNATVGRSAVLLYGADIGTGTRVAPNSVVMKHEHLLAEHSYEGAPTQHRIAAFSTPSTALS